LIQALNQRVDDLENRINRKTNGIWAEVKRELDRMRWAIADVKSGDKRIDWHV
jgi:hypothetical protein